MGCVGTNSAGWHTCCAKCHDKIRSKVPVRCGFEISGCNVRTPSCGLIGSNYRLQMFQRNIHDIVSVIRPNLHKITVWDCLYLPVEKPIDILLRLAGTGFLGDEVDLAGAARRGLTEHRVLDLCSPVHSEQIRKINETNSLHRNSGWLSRNRKLYGDANLISVVVVRPVFITCYFL